MANINETGILVSGKDQNNLRREMSMSIEERVKGILLNILDIDEKNIVPEASITDDLGASSIDVVELVTALENDFHIEISDEELQEMRTVQGIIDHLKTRISFASKKAT